MSFRSPDLNQLRAQFAEQNINLRRIQATLEAVDPDLRLAIPPAWIEQLDAACEAPARFAPHQPYGALRG
jgi:hypothetical protein